MFFTNGGFRQGTWRNDRWGIQVIWETLFFFHIFAIIRLVGRAQYYRPDGTMEVEVFESRAGTRYIFCLEEQLTYHSKFRIKISKLLVSQNARF